MHNLAGTLPHGRFIFCATIAKRSIKHATIYTGQTLRGVRRQIINDIPIHIIECLSIFKGAVFTTVRNAGCTQEIEIKGYMDKIRATATFVNFCIKDAIFMPAVSKPKPFYQLTGV